jgi:hypothetical protein
VKTLRLLLLLACAGVSAASAQDLIRVDHNSHAILAGQTIDLSDPNGVFINQLPARVIPAMPGSVTAALVSKTSLGSLMGAPTIDAVPAPAGMIVLLAGQTNSAQNGPWVAQTGAWTRPSWYASGSQTVPGTVIYITEGAFQGGSTWVLETASATVDTTATVWQESTNVYAAGNTIEPGNGELDLGSHMVTATGAGALEVDSIYLASANQVESLASGSGTISPANTTAGNIVANVATLANAATVAAPTGTPVDGQRLTLRLGENGTGGYAVTWNAIYSFPSSNPASTLPTAANTKYSIVFEYVAADGVWWAESVANRY